MQDVTENLKKSLARQTPVYAKTVELYRRVWNGSAYVFEETPVDITGQVLDAGRVYWKMDKEGFNQWSLDNTTLTLRNDRQQWKQDNPKGLFPSGYLIHGSKVSIKFGAQLADGTYEKLYIFNGVILGDPIKSTVTKDAVITLAGMMSIFSKFNAEEISTLVEDELLGSAAGTDFPTDNPGVGPIITVKRGLTASGAGDALEIKPTVDYTVENQRTKGTAMTVKLVEALTATESVWISYRYWYTDKSFKWILEQVMTLCGITTYSISDAVFEVLVPNTWEQTLQADWEGDTLTNVDTTSQPDSWKQKWFLVDDFAAGSLSGNVNWNVVHGDWSAASNALTHGPTGVSPDIPEIWAAPGGGSAGSWKLKVGTTGPGQLNYYFITWYTPFSPVGMRGKCYLVFKNGGTVELWQEYYSSTTGLQNTMLGTFAQAFTISDIFTVTRTADNNFVVYFNGVSKLSVAGAYTVGTNNTRTTFIGTFPDGSITIDDIWYSEAIATDAVSYSAPIVETVVIDTTAAVEAWGKFALLGNLGATAATVRTYSSDSSDFSTGLDPAGWVAIDNTGEIQSAVKRYLKIRVTLESVHISLSSTSPVVNYIGITYYTNSVSISLCDFTGMDCLQLIDSLALKCNYERGFTAAGVFIFRPRSTTIPAVMDLKSSTNVVSLQNVVDGVDRVYNLVTATCGAYTNFSSAAGDTQPNSVDKYDTQKYTVPTDSLLPAENVNLAYAITPTILAYSKTPRRRCQALCMILPHLELGDKVNLTFEEPTALRSWKWGDSNVVYGQADIEYYDEADKAARIAFSNTPMRIEGLEISWFNEMQCTLDLVEVL